MSGGRPNKGIGHVDKLDADESTKERIRAILQTISGDVSVKDAAERLGIGVSRFHELRDSFLEGGASGLAPGQKGRPAHEEDPKDHEIEVLKNRIQELEIDVETTRLREQIALSMPHLVEGRDSNASEKIEAEKKREKRKKEKQKKRAKRKLRRIRKKK